jgi:MraZ protein
VSTFTGQYFFAIDKKSRLTIPQKLRAAINRSKEGYDLVACVGYDSLLYLYTQRDYELNAPKFDAKAQTNPRVRNYLRIKYGLKEDLEIDSLGRVLIPESMLKHFGLSREVALIGVDDHMEVWPRDRWNEHVKKELEVFDETAAQVLNPAAPAGAEASAAAAAAPAQAPAPPPPGGST